VEIPQRVAFQTLLVNSLGRIIEVSTENRMGFVWPFSLAIFSASSNPFFRPILRLNGEPETTASKR